MAESVRLTREEYPPPGAGALHRAGAAAPPVVAATHLEE